MRIGNAKRKVNFQQNLTNAPGKVSIRLFGDTSPAIPTVVSGPLPGAGDIQDSNSVYLLDESSRFIEQSTAIVPPATPALSITIDATSTIEALGGSLWWGRATMQINSLGEWVLVYREGDSHTSGGNDKLHIRFSDDYGVTWSNRDQYLDGTPIVGFPIDPAGWGVNEGPFEPWLYKAPNDDLVLHFWRISWLVSMNGTYQSVSNDDGLNWSAEAAVNFTGIAGDNFIFSTDDDFVIGGTIYAAARVYTNVAASQGRSIFIKSTDNGATWDFVSNITDENTFEIGMEYLGSNEIYGLLRSINHRWVFEARSYDMGLTWNYLEIVNDFGSVMGRTRMFTREHLKLSANWWEDDFLVLAGYRTITPGSGHPRRNCIWLSHNRGALWQGPFYLDAQTEDAGYGDVQYNPLTDRYVMVNYQGSLDEAELKQYIFEIVEA